MLIVYPATGVFDTVAANALNHLRLLSVKWTSGQTDSPGHLMRWPFSGRWCFGNGQGVVTRAPWRNDKRNKGMGLYVRDIVAQGWLYCGAARACCSFPRP